MEMSVTIAENKKKLIWKKCSASEHERAEKNHAAGNRSKKVAQFALVLATRKSRDENVDEQICQDGENHGETAKSSDLRHRSGVTSEETDQEDGDLSLKTIKKRVRGQAFDQPNDLTSVFRIFARL